jgi:hypothetical protein
MIRGLLKVLALAVMSLAIAGPARAAIFYVGSPDDAACDFDDLQAAINHAATMPGADVIRVVHTRSYVGQPVFIQDSGDLNVVGGYHDCSDGTASGEFAVLDGAGSNLPLISVQGTGTVKLRFLALQNNLGWALQVITGYGR